MALQNSVALGDLKARASKSARAFRLGMAALDNPRLAKHPLKATLAEREFDDYVKTMGQIQAEAQARIDAAKTRLEAARQVEAERQADALVAAFKGIPQGAIETFRGQAARMSTRELWQTFQRGADWQKAIIRETFTARPLGQPSPDETAEHSSLAMAFMGQTDAAKQIAADETAIGLAETELQWLDEVGHEAELRQRYDIREPVGAVSDEFHPDLVDLAAYTMERDARQMAGVTLAEAMQ